MSKISEDTQAVLDFIAQDESKSIYPSMYAPFFWLANISAAFRIAKKTGMIVQDGVDGIGKPKYKKLTASEGVTVH